MHPGMEMFEPTESRVTATAAARALAYGSDGSAVGSGAESIGLSSLTGEADAPDRFGARMLFCAGKPRAVRWRSRFMVIAVLLCVAVAGGYLYGRLAMASAAPRMAPAPAQSAPTKPESAPVAPVPKPRRPRLRGGAGASALAERMELMPLPSEPEFRVTRRTQPAPPDERLSAAWGALLHGDPAAAKGRYAEVLTTDPENRQALLAMAAIESRAGETVRARRYYLRLLQRDPTDPLALAGLLDGEPAADPLMRESRLKQLIARHPDLAVLHSALGSHYAREQRWLDARRAYEQAANIEGTLGARHPDTIFNLAVALDHLGRRREALARYQEALNGARRIPSGFEPGTAEARVRALSES